MNPEKSQFKILVVNEIGNKVEDKYESELKSTHELAGGAEALRQAAIKVPAAFAAKIDAELEEGKIDEGMLPQHVAQYAKKYLARVGDFLRHLADVEQQKATSQGGRTAAIRDIIDNVLSKMREEESKKLQQAIEVVKEEEVLDVEEKKEEQNPEPSVEKPARTVAEAARAEHGSLADRRKTKANSNPRRRKSKVK